MVLSGGVSQNVNPYQYALDNTSYSDYLAQVPTGVGYPDWIGQQQMLAAHWNTQNPAPAFNVGVSYQQPPQTAYSVPVQSYSAPTLPVSTGGAGDNIAVDYSPVQVSNYSQNIEPTPFPNMPGFTPQEAPGFMNIGGRNYGADQLIAANPQQSFAPGVPQMDTVSDGAYGYDATRIPDQPQAMSEGQSYSLGGEMEPLPNEMMGVPNPYMQKPQAPVYTQQPAYQAAMAVPQQAINSLPTLDQFYQPSPAPQANTLTGALKRMVWATQGQARMRAAQYQDAREQQKEAANRQAMLMQVSLPAQIGLNREILQQQGADSRVAANAFYQGSLAALNFHLDVKEKQMLRASDALQLATNAFAQPSIVNGQYNRQKIMMLREAGKNLGWTESDVAALVQQQDPGAADQLMQQSLKTEQMAHDLSKAKKMLTHEINMLGAQIAETQAQTGVLNAQSATAGFNLKQREKVAKYERWGQIADAMNKVDAMLVNRDTRKAKGNSAQLANEKLQADIFRQEMEAKAVPVEVAARMAGAMASMGQSVDPNIKAAGAGMADSVYGLLGLTERNVVKTDASGNTVVEKVPVTPPSTVSNFQRQMQQPQPGYRQRMAQPQQLPPQYFSGGSLAGIDNNNGFSNMNGGQPQPGAY